MRVGDLTVRLGAAWEPALAHLLSWARDVTAALSALRLRDQVRVVRDVVIDTGALPAVIEMPPRTQAIGVVLVRAVELTSADGIVITGGAVTWETVERGVRVHAIDSLASSTRYAATIAVVE